MALLLLVTIFIGFAPTYYLAGVFHAPLPSLIIHLHGAAFTCWILLLVTQTSLVAGGRVDIHRRLGIAGFLLACLVVILGVLAATDSLVRRRTGRIRNFLRGPAHGHGDFRGADLFCVSLPLEPGNPQEADFDRLLWAIARRPCALADSLRSRQTVRPLVSLIYSEFAFLDYDFGPRIKLQRATLWAGTLSMMACSQIRLLP